MMKRSQERDASAAGTPGVPPPLSQAVRKRSITIAGHRTSVSLEDAFWALLRQIAEARGGSVSDLVTQIDKERSGNLSSAIRIYVLREIVAGFDPQGHTSQDS